MPRSTYVLPFAVLGLLAACAGTSGRSGASSSSSAASATSMMYAEMPANLAYLKSGDTRSFHVKYVGHVTEIPAGTKTLRVWLPVPQSTNVQTIADLEFSGGTPRMGTEKKFGNLCAYFEVQNPGATADFTMAFSCTRAEQVTDFAALGSDGTETDPKAATFLAPDKLTIVDDRIRKMAAEITAGKKTTVEKARAIYDYTVSHMTYDKSGKGWGNGDTNYACDVGKGNCTDFHALFMSLCRASNIPAGFEIGLYLPYEKGKKEALGGYHCWSFFRVPGRTWVPIDASEAGKNPAKKDYFFGAHTSNRVTLSVGRDLILEPAQFGAPLNYFLVPYAEADGKPAKTGKDWEYTEL